MQEKDIEWQSFATPDEWNDVVSWIVNGSAPWENVQSTTLHDVEKLLSQENMQCNSVFEVMAHRAMFYPLHRLVFWEKKTQAIKWLDKQSRELFFRDENRFKKVMDFFKNKENIKLLSEAIVWDYKEHKEAFDKVWIDYSHKNTAWLFISYLKRFIDSLGIPKTTKIDKTSIVFQDDAIPLSKRFEDWFREFLKNVKQKFSNSKNIADAIVAMDWNISGEIGENTLREFSKINSILAEGLHITPMMWHNVINTDTREPIKLNIFWKDYFIKWLESYDETWQYIEAKITDGKTLFENILLDKNLNPILTPDWFLLSDYNENGSVLHDKNFKTVVRCLDKDFNIIKTDQWRELVGYNKSIVELFYNQRLHIWRCIDEKWDSKQILLLFTKDWKFVEFTNTKEWYNVLSTPFKEKNWKYYLYVEIDWEPVKWRINKEMNFEKLSFSDRYFLFLQFLWNFGK